MERASLSLVTTVGADGYTVRVGGELDMSTAPELEERLTTIVRGDVHLDLAQLDFCDSSGLSMLALFHGHLERDGRRLFIHGATPIVRRAMDVTGLADYLGLEDDVTSTGTQNVA